MPNLTGRETANASQYVTEDASDLLLPHVRRFTVGFVLTDPPTPSVLGSGVLVSVGPGSGILTCPHVAEQYRNRSDIGLLRFSRDETMQMQKLRLRDTNSLYIEEDIGEPRWNNPRAIWETGMDFDESVEAAFESDLR